MYAYVFTQAYIDELFAALDDSVMEDLIRDLSNPTFNAQVSSRCLYCTAHTRGWIINSHLCCLNVPGDTTPPLGITQDGVLSEEVYFNIELRRVQENPADDDDVDVDGVSQEATQMNHKVLFDRLVTYMLCIIKSATDNEWSSCGECI